MSFKIEITGWHQADDKDVMRPWRLVTCNVKKDARDPWTQVLWNFQKAFDEILSQLDERPRCPGE